MSASFLENIVNVLSDFLSENYKVDTCEKYRLNCNDKSVTI